MPDPASTSADLSRLPAPPAEALLLSERLQQQLRDRIARHGPLSFAAFMQAALYAPGLGYYTAGLAKFGAEGDFITAPELGGLFGSCVARQCQEILGALPDGGDILEFGAGSGALAGQILAELARRDRLPRHYDILELSADLRDRQRAHLANTHPQLIDRIRWLDALPDHFTGVVLANELLDALPVERFVIEADRIAQLLVNWDGTRWHWATQAAPADVLAAITALQSDLGASFPVGYIGEYAAALAGWMHTIGRILQRGALLLTDYGSGRRFIYHPERRNGTLKCHYRQHVHDDPLQLIGLQDITCDVDFTAVVEAGIGAGLEFAGYTSQANFLIGCGLTDLLADPLDTREQLQRAQEVKRLTLPDGMGEAFKAIAFTRGLAMPLRGFGLRDLRHQL